MTELRDGEPRAAAGAAPDTARAEEEEEEEKKPRGEEERIAATMLATSEVQLTAATGGAEMSCYRCTVPFGVVVTIAGVVVTAVAYAFNTHGSTICVLGLVLLSAGLLLLAASATCWRVGHARQKESRRESQAALVATRGSVFV